jgi:hypothetical protein
MGQWMDGAFSFFFLSFFKLTDALQVSPVEVVG